MKNYTIITPFVDDQEVVKLHKRYFHGKNPKYGYYSDSEIDEPIFQSGFYLLTIVDLSEEEVTYLSLALICKIELTSETKYTSRHLFPTDEPPPFL